MNQEEQGKKTNQVKSDATVKEVIPAKPTALSDEDLDKVAGGNKYADDFTQINTKLDALAIGTTPKHK